MPYFGPLASVVSQAKFANNLFDLPSLQNPEEFRVYPVDQFSPIFPKKLVSLICMISNYPAAVVYTQVGSLVWHLSDLE